MSSFGPADEFGTSFSGDSVHSDILRFFIGATLVVCSFSLLSGLSGFCQLIKKKKKSRNSGSQLRNCLRLPVGKSMGTFYIYVCVWGP